MLICVRSQIVLYRSQILLGLIEQNVFQNLSNCLFLARKCALFLSSDLYCCAWCEAVLPISVITLFYFPFNSIIYKLYFAASDHWNDHTRQERQKFTDLIHLSMSLIMPLNLFDDNLLDDDQ